MSDYDSPEFLLPFTFTEDGSALECEQGSATEIQQSVYAILAYELGYRIDLPTFGLEDQAFRVDGVDLERVAAVIERWDPRAVELIESDPNWIHTVFQTVTVRPDPNG